MESKSNKRDWRHNYMRSILINEEKRVVTVVFHNGDVRIVKCAPEDDFDPEIGVCLAIARHKLGSKSQIRKIVGCKAKVISKKEGTEQEPELEHVAKPDYEKLESYNHVPFFSAWLEKNGLSVPDAAKLANVSEPTIRRAKEGLKIRQSSFMSIVSAFGLTTEEAELLRKSVRR